MADPRETDSRLPMTRRQFLGAAGAGLAALLEAACGPLPATATSTTRPTLQPTASPTQEPTIVPSPTPEPIARPRPTETPKPIETTVPTLKDYAVQQGIEIGNLGTGLRLTSPEYIGHGETLKTNFNLVTSDYELLWNAATPSNKPFRPSPGGYDFELGDQLFSFAKENQMVFQVHHLIDGREWILPDWLKNRNYSREDIIKIMRDHITRTVSHYANKGVSMEWSVINEYGTRNDGVRNWWVDKLGRDNHDWIEEAFITAHEADPNAKLFLNDFGIEYGGAKADEIFNLVKTLKEKGIPLDGVGFQFHLNGGEFIGDVLRQKVELMKRQIARYKEIGTEIYVTEFDVRSDTIAGNQEQQFQAQADIYRAHMEGFLDSGVKSIAFFGISDKDSFYNDTVINGVRLSNANATLFDRQYVPKPAYNAILEIMQNKQ